MKLKLLRALFGGHRAEATPAPTPSAAELERERRQAEAERAKQAAARDRAEREREEAERDAMRHQASIEEIEQACKTQGFWWPEDGAPLNRFGTPRRRGLLARVGEIFGGW